MAEIATTHVLVIQGTSVENPEAEFFALYSTSDNTILKVTQVQSQDDGSLMLLLKSINSTFMVITNQLNSVDALKVITIDTSMSNGMKRMA